MEKEIEECALLAERQKYVCAFVLVLASNTLLISAIPFSFLSTTFCVNTLQLPSVCWHIHINIRKIMLVIHVSTFPVLICSSWVLQEENRLEIVSTFPVFVHENVLIPPLLKYFLDPSPIPLFPSLFPQLYVKKKNACICHPRTLTKSLINFSISSSLLL